MIENPVRWVPHDDDRCGDDCGKCGAMVMGGTHWHVGNITGTIYHETCGDSLGAHASGSADKGK